MDRFYKPKHTQENWHIEEPNENDPNNKTTYSVYAGEQDRPLWIAGNINGEANAELIALAPELLKILFWISRAAKMKGPVPGTTAYIISDEHMEKAKELAKKLTIE